MNNMHTDLQRRRVLRASVGALSAATVPGLASLAALAQTSPIQARNVSLADDPFAASLERADAACVPMAKGADDQVALLRDVLLESSRHTMSTNPGSEDYVWYRYPTCDVLPSEICNMASDGYFEEASWINRHFAAYRHIRHRPELTDAHRQQLDAWFISLADFQQKHLDHEYYGIGGVFPKRLEGDYAPRPKSDADPDPRYSLQTGKLTHYKGAPIYELAGWWNNRRTSLCLVVAQVGIYYNIPSMIHSAKTYIKEWVTYGVYADGAQGEWLRNGDYGYVTAGVTYGACNEALALLVARALYNKFGDAELLRFQTTDGLFGTASSTPKTIWTAFDTHLWILDQELKGNPTFLDQNQRPFDQTSSPYGCMMHISFCLPALTGLRRKQVLNWMGRIPAGTKLEDPYGKGRGLYGIHFDVTTNRGLSLGPSGPVSARPA